MIWMIRDGGQASMRADHDERGLASLLKSMLDRVKARLVPEAHAAPACQARLYVYV